MENERIARIIRPIDIPDLLPENISPRVAQLAEYVENEVLPNDQLRRGQKEAAYKTISSLMNGERVVYVEQVSGYGKSRFMDVIGDGYGGKQVYIVPHESGSHAISEKMKLVGKEYGIVNKNEKNFDTDITIINIQSIEKLVQALMRGDPKAIQNGRKLFNADLIFADELHHYLTPKRLELLTIFLRQNPRSVMIGATATDKYNDDKSAEKQFGKCVHRVSLREGVEEGVLISPHVKIILTGLSLDEERVTPEGDYVFSDRIPIRTRDRQLLEGYLEACKVEGKMLRTISYLTSISHAESFVALCEEIGIKAGLVTGDTKNRNEIYDQLERGELDTVATVETAIESLDKNWLEGILDGAPSKSQRVVRQKWPRCMRYIEGKKPPWIIQAVDEMTSYKNKPLLVTDMLGVQKFVNGSIVRPSERQSAGSKDSSVVQSHEEPLVELTLDQESTVETIDVTSLFKMGILDKAQLAGKGMLPEKETNDLREMARTYLNKQLGDYHLLGRFLSGGLSMWDDNEGNPIAIQRIIGKLIGLGADELRSAHYSWFINFLENGKVDYVTEGEKVSKNFYISQELTSLFDKKRNGTISDEDDKKLKRWLIPIAERVKQEHVGMSKHALRGLRVDDDAYKGTLSTLYVHLGIAENSRVVSVSSYNTFLELVGMGSQEGISTIDKGESRQIVLPDNDIQLGDVKAFLRKVFERLSSEAYDLSVFSLGSYIVETQEFTGNLFKLAKKLGCDDKSTISSKSIRRLVEHAGLDFDEIRSRAKKVR